MAMPADADSPVLVVSDDSIVRELLAVILKRRDVKVATASSRSQALALLDAQNFRACFVDARAIAVEGRDLLADLRGRDCCGRLVLVADERDDELLSSAMAGGAAAILTQPFEGDAVIRVLGLFGGRRS